MMRDVWFLRHEDFFEAFRRGLLVHLKSDPEWIANWKHRWWAGGVIEVRQEDGKVKVYLRDTEDSLYILFWQYEDDPSLERWPDGAGNEVGVKEVYVLGPANDKDSDMAYYP